jgi:DNA (cytosine-5)-methyltransferase 1
VDTCETLIAHSLRGEGFDASEDGTGRGTPLVTAFSAKDYGADATEGLTPTLRAGGFDKSHANSGNWMAVAIQNATRGKDQNGLGVSDDGSMYTLDQGSQHAVAFGAQMSTPHWQHDLSDTLQAKNPKAVQFGMAVRRLTPRECERLQGFTDDYTKISDKTADGPRYKALGNSFAVPVVRWIGERIQMVENL